MIALGATLGLLVSAAPAAWAARATLSSLLASSAVRGGGGHARMRRALVVTQVAITLVLLGSGGLVVRSVERLLRADPGFNAEGVLTFRVRSPPGILPAAGRSHRLPGSRRARAAHHSGRHRRQRDLDAAAERRHVPDLDPDRRCARRCGSDDRDSPLVDVVGTRATYVSTMGMRLIAGRAFEPVRQDGRQRR